MKTATKRSLFRQVMRRCLAATLSRRLLLVSGDRRSGSVCLTFDDGPHPEHTGRILDVLKEAGVVATFFVVGKEAEKHPELIRRIVAEGHVLGNHTYSHGDPLRTSANQLMEEMRQTQTTLVRLVGKATSLFRPPHGKVTAPKLWRLWQDRQTVVLWNVDPSDYARASEDELRTWFRQRPLQGGDVVLLHDNVALAAGILGDLIHDARSRGLTFATPSAWLR